ncbi:hypothetical protein SGL43_06583 [Streptomyces globisporus]|uniref:Uncharacterized protein n=1 Tax=Streptomyces globisporus TaxID=1908 RepID=A0ABM9H7A2_STRGL|nr:hypothetical protein [Streptomyces globisporus]CAH9419528.1 hypothetical protein SGL43_06583 [Streptomyces globisporus]
MTQPNGHIFTRNPQLVAGLVAVYEQALADGLNAEDAMLRVLDRALPLHAHSLEAARTATDQPGGAT